MKLALALLYILYWAILGMDCLLIFNKLEEYRLYTKPLVMPALYMIMAFETTDTSHRKSKLIISLVLLFSLGGDLLLINNNDKFFFTLGLLCFLFAHVLYAVFFLRIKPFLQKKAGIIAILFLMIFTYEFLLFYSFWQKIVEAGYAFQVVAYSAFIALMFVAAGNTATGKRAHKVAWRNFIPGAILFIVSDSLLAVAKFYPFVNLPQILLVGLNCAVMFTYGAAQFLLVTGSIKFIKN